MKRRKIFVGGNLAPQIAACNFTGAKGKAWVERPRVTGPALALAGLAATTQKGHRRLLRGLAAMPREYDEAPLVPALLSWTNALRREKRWRWSTTAHHLASLQGALKLAALYTMAPVGIAVSADPVWRMAMKAMARLTAGETPYQARPMTEASIQTVLQHETTVSPQEAIHLRALIVVAWLTAQRPLCLMRANTRDVMWDAPTRQLGVTVRRGKTAASRGPYTVWTTVPAPMTAAFQLWWDVAPEEGPAWKTSGKAVKDQLRTAGEDFEQRSLRRGALQCMARNGVSPSDLLLFSGHATQKTLLRYLGYGKLDSSTRSKMTGIARAVFEQ